MIVRKVDFSNFLIIEDQTRDVLLDLAAQVARRVSSKVQTNLKRLRQAANYSS